MFELLVRWLEENRQSTLPLALTCKSLAFCIPKPQLKQLDLDTNNVSFFKEIGCKDFCRIAGRKGDIDLARTIFPLCKECSQDPNPKHFCLAMYCCALEEGHIPMLEWILKERPEFIQNSDNSIGFALINPKISVFQLLRKYGLQWGIWFFTTAIQKGSIEFLKWLDDNHCPWSHSLSISNAIAYRRRDILIWLLAHPMLQIDNDHVCNVFAYHGDLPGLQWAREQGHGWSYSTVIWAASQGHIQILEWAFQNGVPWTIWPRSNFLWNPNVIQWMVERGYLL